MSRRRSQINENPGEYIGAEAVHALMPAPDTELRAEKGQYYLGMIYFPRDSEIKKSDSDPTTDLQKCRALLNNPKTSDAMSDEDKRLFVNFEETLRAWQQKISAQQSSSSRDNVTTLHFEVYDPTRRHFTRLLVMINQDGAVTDIQHRDTLHDQQRKTSSSAEVAVAEIVNGVNGVFPASASNSATTASTSAQIPCRYVAANLQQRNSTCADCTILSTWHDVQPVRLAELLNKLKPLGDAQQDIALPDNGAQLETESKTLLDTHVSALLADGTKLRAFTKLLEQEFIISVYQKLGWFVQLEKKAKEDLLKETVVASCTAISEQLKNAGQYDSVTVTQKKDVTAQSDRQFVLEFAAQVKKPSSAAEQKDFSITCDVLQDANGKSTGEVKWTCNTLPWKEAYAVIAAQSFQLFKTESEKLAAEITRVRTALEAARARSSNAAESPATTIAALEAQLRELTARQIDQRAIEIYNINDNDLSSQRAARTIGGVSCNNVTEKEAQLIQAHFDAGFTKVIYNDTTYRPSAAAQHAAVVSAATVPQQPPTAPTQPASTTTPTAPQSEATPPTPTAPTAPQSEATITQPQQPISGQPPTPTPPAAPQSEATPPTAPTQPASTTTPPAPLQLRGRPPAAPQPIGGQLQPNEVGAMDSKLNKLLEISKFQLAVHDKLDKIPPLKEEISHVENLIRSAQSFSSDASGKSFLPRPRIAERPRQLEQLVVQLEREVGKVVVQGQQGVKTAEKPQHNDNEQLLKRLAVLTKTLNYQEKKLNELLAKSEALKNPAPAPTQPQQPIGGRQPRWIQENNKTTARNAMIKQQLSKLGEAIKRRDSKMGDKLIQRIDKLDPENATFKQHAAQLTRQMMKQVENSLRQAVATRGTVALIKELTQEIGELKKSSSKLNKTSQGQNSNSGPKFG